MNADNRYQGGIGIREAAAGTIGTGAVIAAALALATPEIMHWEGKRTLTYLDIAQVPTACYGHAGPKAGPVGTRWTDADCEALLDQDVKAHMAGALKCAPTLAARPQQLGAATILTYNIGVSAFCRSTIARRFNAGDWKGGCDAFLLWTRAGERVVKGLVNRRRAERRLCLKGL